MANRVPLIVDTTTLNIKELPAGDSLDLTNSGIVNAGVITATSFKGSLTGIGTGADKIKVVDESSDTSCNIIYATDPVGYFEPKSGSNLTFNSNTGQLNATIFSGTTVSATTGTFTGNVSVGGTLTYEDVTNQDVLGLSTFRSGIRINTGGINVTAGISTFGALVDVNNRIDVVGGANIDQANVSGVSTFGGAVDINANVDVSGTISITGVDIDLGSNGLDTGDNKGLKFGDGDDFLIYHTGGGSGPNVIDNAGNDSGGLEIRHNAEVQAKFVPDGEVILYHDNAVRITTTADGADIGGTGSLKIPVGTTGQRSGSPTNGDFRYNSTDDQFEGYSDGSWGAIGGGAQETDTSVSTTNATAVYTVAHATYRSASLILQITQGSAYQSGRYMVIHDGTTATIVEESAVATGSMLGTFTADISGSNLRVLVNMTSASSATVTVIPTPVTV